MPLGHRGSQWIHGAFLLRLRVFHVGNVWIRPWANFAQYMDRTFLIKRCASCVLFFLSMLSATGRAYTMLRQNEWCYSVCSVIIGVEHLPLGVVLPLVLDSSTTATVAPSVVSGRRSMTQHSHKVKLLVKFHNFLPHWVTPNPDPLSKRFSVKSGNIFRGHGAFWLANV